MLPSLLLTTLATLLLSLLPAHATAQPSVPGPYPVIAHYSFDTPSFASQFNNYTAAAPAGAQPPLVVTAQSGAACPFGACAAFSGSRYLAIAPWLPLLGGVEGAALGGWGVAVWVKSEASGWQGVLGEWGQGSYVWSLRLNNNNPQLIWQYYDASNTTQRVQLSSSGSVSPTGWTHLALSYNATAQTLSCWLDGTRTDTWQVGAVYASLGGAPATGWKVGMIDDVMYGFTGALDELWAFAAPLNDVQVILLQSINSIGTCLPGTAGVAYYGMGVCTPCAPGTYASDVGSLVCTACPAGATSPASGASACQACAAGTFAASPSAACQSCAAGYFAPVPGASSCLACPAGSYSAAGALTCSTCPANSLSPPASTSASACAACNNSGSGGGSIPVCCPRGVSASGRLLAATAGALSQFNTASRCVLQKDVTQQAAFVGTLSEVCGDGYDSVLTSGLQAVYSDFNAFVSQADTTQLTQAFCNP